MYEGIHFKDKICSWLVEEDIKISEVTNPLSDFQLTLKNAFGLNLVIDIAKPKEKSFIIIAIKIKYPQEMQTFFSSLTNIEKFEFLEKAKRILLEQNVDFTMSENLDYLDIVNYVYLEDFSRTIFMNSIKSIRNASIITISTLIEEFSLVNNPTPHHTHSNLISPYG